jgi:hypothetical protein
MSGFNPWIRMPFFDQTSVAITGGSISGQVTGVPVTQSKSALPMISVSTGSMANNGAISGLTALPFTYASCYLYLPTNAIVAGSAAGWYYAQMSSATAGTVFNNTYTTGVPTIPTSPTAFATTGPGAFTGDTTEQGITLPIPALLVTSEIEYRVVFQCNNNANVKTARVRFSGSSGSQYTTIGITSTNGVQDSHVIRKTPNSFIDPA